MYGIMQITAEREHQIDKGYTVEHDTHHSVVDLQRAAEAYLTDVPEMLPWGYNREAWGKQTRQERLVKAGALIAAALDQMGDR